MEKFKIDEKMLYDSELDKYSRELYNAFIKDTELYEEVKSQGISDQEIYDNIGLFSDVKADREKEKLVKTFEDCKKYDCYYHTTISRNSFGFEKVYDAIEPYKEHLRYLSHFIVKDYNDDYNNIEWKKLDNKQVKSEMRKELVANKWIYLTGAIRSGRTFLAIGMLNAFLAKNDEKVAFIDAPKRFGELARLYFSDRKDFEEVLSELKECEYLVIDNFGSEVKNSIVRDGILIPLLEARAVNNKHTLFTSNHDIKRIVKMYEIKKDAGGEIAAESLNNILRSMVSHEINVSNVALY